VCERNRQRDKWLRTCVSTMSVSREKRFRMRPVGVVSKNAILPCGERDRVCVNLYMREQEKEKERAYV